ncbi:MAG: hypothetical protein KDA80_19080, partial [Planctomycetaceae bacterium]|nr:hypothetical protein [Planctomycetaceae bacterium]
MLPKDERTLPQTGYHLDSVWADAIDISVKQFRKNVRELKVPHLVFGASVIVSAEDFYSRLREIRPDSP